MGFFDSLRSALGVDSGSSGGSGSTGGSGGSGGGSRGTGGSGGGSRPARCTVDDVTTRLGELGVSCERGPEPGSAIATRREDEFTYHFVITCPVEGGRQMVRIMTYRLMSFPWRSFGSAGRGVFQLMSNSEGFADHMVKVWEDYLSASECRALAESVTFGVRPAGDRYEIYGFGDFEYRGKQSLEQAFPLYGQLLTYSKQLYKLESTPELAKLSHVRFGS